MKKTVLILAIFMSLQAFAQFDKYFENRTMRIDYYHAGDAKTEAYYIDEIIAEDYWGGSLTNLIEPTKFGKFYVKVYDAASNQLIFGRSYSTLFGEWQTVDESKTIKKSFSESVVFPYPKNKVIVAFLSKSFETGDYVEKYRFEVDPNDKCIVKHDNRHKYPVYEVLDNGKDYNKKVDIVIIPDGYTEQQMDLFKSDCKKFVDEMFKFEPYTSRKSDFNIHAV
ncbi:MAG: peptidase M64, partial [Bacteroidales bacterium]|nr:peptidase M64 [Bacteroidales bacterium]